MKEKDKEKTWKEVREKIEELKEVLDRLRQMYIQ